MKSFLKKSALCSASCLQALSVTGMAVGAIALAAPAAAQDYTRGVLAGTVVDEAGQPVAGAQVTVRSNEQGFSQATTTNAAGDFSVSALPTGSYTVTISAGGTPVVEDRGATVLAGQTNSYRYVAASAGAVASEDNAIVVLGQRVQTADFTETQTGLTIDVADLAATVPVGRDQTSLILLAPGTTAGDAGFGNLASIGGATVAENAYYVNGLNITNFRNGLGGGRLPFEFYRTLDVKTGGYQAEYGRALGGVTSAVTKSGSNEFEAGVIGFWSPDALRETSPNTFVDEDTDASTVGDAISQYNEADYRESYEANIYLSGPIVKDRLFFYALYAPSWFDYADTTLPNRRRLASEQKTDFMAAKVDAVITDGHRLEFTYFNDEQKRETEHFFVDPDSPDTLGPSQGVVTTEFGGHNFIGQYTGQFTDWFTLSLAYGQYNDKTTQATDPNVSFVNTVFGPGGTVRGTVIGDVNETNKREFYRADADLYADFFGEHHFRAGFDYEDLTAGERTAYTGDGSYYTLYPGYMFRRFYFNEGEFNTKQRAFYLQDQWSLLDGRLNLNLGIRNDRFKNYTQNGDLYYDSGDNWGPRLGGSFDLFGDGSTKINAFWGRYFLPIATNTNIRLAGAEIYTLEVLEYPPEVTGVDANGDGVYDELTFNSDGAPANGGTYVGGGDCPAGSPGFGNEDGCYRIYGDGTLGAVDTLISSTLRPSYTDEWIIGAEHRVGDWTFALNYINRRLGETLEDAAIDAAVIAYCEENGIAGCASEWTGYHQYTLINPGKDVTVRLDGDCDIAGQCDVATLRAEDLGYPAAQRNYDAISFQAQKAFNGFYGFNFNYTWTNLEGNFEGAVKSDNNQTDAGITQDFDQPGFLDGAYGRLANEREHSFKLFGRVQPTEWLNIGINASLESPRPFSCIGNYFDAENFAYGYGAASYYCTQSGYGGTPVTNSGYDEVNGTADDQTSYLIPRGSAFESDWNKQIDLSFGLTPFAQFPGVMLRADIFNVFNWKSELDYDEFGDFDFTLGNPDGSAAPHPNYGRVTGYQAPRSVRLSLAFRFGGEYGGFGF